MARLASVWEGLYPSYTCPVMQHLAMACFAFHLLGVAHKAQQLTVWQAGNVLATGAFEANYRIDADVIHGEADSLSCFESRMDAIVGRLQKLHRLQLGVL